MTHIDRTECSGRRHGTESAYSKFGCRCPDARRLWTRYNYELRHGIHVPRLVDITPTSTRLRILAALGYDWRTLTRAAEYSTPKQITELAYAERPTVHRRTQAHIAALFADLTGRPQPHGYAAGRAVDNARRAGWGLVDPEVINRALAGARPDLTPLEKDAVLYIGVARGLTATAIATAARANTRSVHAITAA